MKKKIFITGEVREYDSANPKTFTDGIEQYLLTNIVAPNSNIRVIATSTDDTITIKMPFTTGDDITPGTISRNLYRCFTGECPKFTAENSLWWGFGFGAAFPMNVRFDIDDIKDAHKKNTRFYKASRYKQLDIVEDPQGLTINITY
jgi:hypothetical protein